MQSAWSHFDGTAMHCSRIPATVGKNIDVHVLPILRAGGSEVEDGRTDLGRPEVTLSEGTVARISDTTVTPRISVFVRAVSTQDKGPAATVLRIVQDRVGSVAGLDEIRSVDCSADDHRSNREQRCPFLHRTISLVQ